MKLKLLEQINQKEVIGCIKCPLHKGRTKTVFGEGNPDADLMFIGEGPGEQEDLTGRPFVGRSGQLLDKMIASINLKRSDVYIANLVKCRPPKNRAPTVSEVVACNSYLKRQIEIINPRIIVTLGLSASGFILQLPEPMKVIHGRLFPLEGDRFVVPIYHPAYLLRNYSVDNRKKVWEAFQMISAELKKEPHERTRF